MKKLTMESLNRLTTEEFKTSEKHNFCFILDDIRSMANVGSIFRTSDAFLAQKVYLCGITAKPPHREIEKTALGATETVEWEHHDSAVSLCYTLKEEGWKIVVIEQVDESLKLNKISFDPKMKYAFILGNEVFGVRQEIVDFAELIIEIPQFGTKHSLNVSVTAGIIAWDYWAKING